MSSGSSVRTHIAVQTDKDTVPNTGWQTLPVVTNGLTNTTTLTDSEIISSGRIKSQGMVTSGEITGDISTELMFGVFDDLLEAVFWNTWTTKTESAPSQLTIGDNRKFFAITKDFTDVNLHYLFTGVHVNTFSLEITTDNLVNVTFGLMGLGFDASNKKSFAKSPAPSVDGKKASGLSIGDILSDGQNIGVCVESFNLEIDNQAEIQRCLGKNVYGGNILAMLANITGSMTIAYGPKAYDLLELQRTGAKTSIEIPIEFSPTEKYIIKLPSVQVSGDIPSPSPTDIVTAEVNFTVVDESPIIVREG